MDRFKFKVWDKDEMCFSKDWLLIQSNGLLELVYEGCDEEDGIGYVKINQNQYIICQCTGLKDKNGKLIYENDIMGGGVHGTVIVGWNKEFMCFESQNIDKEEFDENGFSNRCLFANDLEDCFNEWEIIGNIYENPELIK